MLCCYIRCFKSPDSKTTPTFTHLSKTSSPIGYNLYCVDYTQDFSGTLSRTNLISFLMSQGFQLQSQLQGTQGVFNERTILENTSSVGNNVCTWISTENEKTIRVKLYNKIVSNFEAGEVQSHLVVISQTMLTAAMNIQDKHSLTLKYKKEAAQELKFHYTLLKEEKKQLHKTSCKKHFRCLERETILYTTCTKPMEMSSRTN